MTEDWIKITSFEVSGYFRATALRQAQRNPGEFLRTTCRFEPGRCEKYIERIDFVLTHAIDYQALMKVDSWEEMLLIYAKFDTIRAVEYRMMFE